MNIQITSVRMEGGEGHQFITTVYWTNPQDGSSSSYTMAEVVDMIESKTGNAYITDGGNRLCWMGIVQTPTTKYIRAVLDREWVDDLLYIPRS